MNLTDRQKELLSFIQNFRKQNDYSPTVREIAKGMNLSSSSTVHAYLERLRRDGYIAWEPGTTRTIRVVKV